MGQGMVSPVEAPIVYKRPKDPGFDSSTSQGDVCHVLLLGTGFSGKSTLFYQMSRIDSRDTFTTKLGKGHIPHIFFNAYLITCGVGNECLSKNSFEKPESKALFQKIEGFGKGCNEANSFHEVLKGSSFSSKTRRYDIFIPWMELWNDEGMISNLLSQKLSLFYFDGAEHFCRVDVLERMSSLDYSPTDVDILRSRKKTTGISKIQLDSKNLSYEFIDVGGQQSERRKWKAVLKEADVLLYIVSLSDFDEFLWEDMTINRMKEALETFEETVNIDYFKDVPLMVVFNKEDLLVKKIQEKDSLKEFWPEYTGGQDPVSALNFIQDQFLNLYKGAPENLHHLHAQLLDHEHVKEGFELLESICTKLKNDGKIKVKVSK